MNWQTLTDPALTGRLCLMLFHSVWQVALLALVAWTLERLWGKRWVERAYALHATALVGALVAMPITFALVEVAPIRIDASTSPQSVATAAKAELSPASTGNVTLPAVGNQSQAVDSTGSTSDLSPAPTQWPSATTDVGSSSSTLWLQMTPWIVGLYTVGVAVMLIRLMAAIWQAHRLGSNAQLLTDGPALDVLNSVTRRWSLRIVPLLAQAEHVVVPKIVGLARPMILLPASTITGLLPDELEMILVHELAHVRRNDMWVNLIQRLAEAVLFFNPALWYLSRRISMLREYCCDELTCRAMSPSDAELRMRYAAALLRVVELAKPSVFGCRDRSAPVSSDLAALAASGRSASELRRRVARLFGEPLREPVRISRGGLLSLGILAIFLLTGPIVWNTAADSAPPRVTDDVADNSETNDVDTPMPSNEDNIKNDAEKANTSDASTPVGNRRQSISTAARTGPLRQFELWVVGPDGNPVPHATVEIRAKPLPAAKHIKCGELLERGKYGLSAKADAEGRFLVQIPLKPKWFKVRIEEPGYGPYWASWDSESHPLLIPAKFTAELEEAWTVGGVIVDSSGHPIPGVSVNPSIRPKQRPGNSEAISGGKRQTTDADGRWSYSSVPASMREVFVELDHPEYKPNRRPLTRSKFGIESGQEPTAAIALERGLTVTGTVTDESGKPVAGVLVRTKFLNDIREATTDEQGKYHLIGCEPRMVRIVVSAKGRATDMQEVRIDPDMEPVDFKMQPGGHVRVRVLDEHNHPIPKARIFFQRWRGRLKYFEFDHVSQYADENGVWEWNEAPLDEFQADICRPGGMQLSKQSLIARAEEYVFRPPRRLVVTGNVVDAVTKAPIKRFRVIPGLRNPDPGIRMNWIPGDSYEASDGRYRISLSHGYPAHLVRIEADGYQVAISRDIKTDEGNVTIDFQLQPAKDIAATVLTPDGNAARGAKIALGVAGSQISVKNGDIDDGSTYATRLDTGKFGRFRFPARDEAFQIVITHPSGFAHLKSTDGPVPSTIALIPWARVEGTFRVGPRPIPNVAVTLNVNSVHSYGDDVPSIFTHHDVTTDRNGRFVFERVFPGKGYLGRRIWLMVNEGATEVTSSLKVSVELPAGKTMRIDLGGTGRPVVGRLMPPADYAGKVYWSFALVNVQRDLPRPKSPPPPVDVQDDPEKRKAWWNAWKETNEGKAWQAAYRAFEKLRSESPYFTASVDRDGSFRIDDMPTGDYVLSVRFSQHQAGRLMNHQFSLPSVDGDSSDQPFDLDTLVLEDTSN